MKEKKTIIRATICGFQFDSEQFAYEDTAKERMSEMMEEYPRLKMEVLSIETTVKETVV